MNRKQTIFNNAVSFLSSMPSARYNKFSYRAIWDLAWPVIVANLLQTLTMTVDVIMVGRLGAEAIASVGLGMQIMFVAMAVMMALGMGTIALVSRHIGAMEPKRADNVLRQSLYLGIFLSIPIMFIGYFLASHILILYGAEAEVVSLGSSYIRTLSLAAPFTFVSFLSIAALRGTGDTKTPMFVGAGINLVNVVLNYVLIFGNFGFPRLGVLGAAIGTACSFVFGAFTFLLIFLSGKKDLRLRPKLLPPDRTDLRRIIHVGGPAALEQLVIQSGFVIYTVMVVSFGTEVYAAHQVGMRIQSLSFMPGMGFSMAAAALVGQSLGAKQAEEAEKFGKGCTKLAVGTMATISVFIFIFAEVVALVFTDSSEVIAYASSWIRILALGIPPIAVFFTFAGALRGAGDTKWPLYASLTGLYGARLPLAYFLGYHTFLGIYGIWLAMILEYYVRSSIISVRFSKGKWKEIEV